MMATHKMRFHVLSAVLAGMALRTLFILNFPVNDAGDSPFYIGLGWNWLKHGVYGLVVNGHLIPVDMRVPGYPAFLAGIFALAGKSERTVMFAQAALDILACFAIALIAARLAPPPARRRVAIAGLWLSALCPFTANYNAAILTETLAIFLTTVAILVLLQTEFGADGSQPRAVRANFSLSPWLLAGIIVGFGTLVRPEAPLLLLAAGLMLLARWWRPANWRRLIRATVLMAVGLFLPLAPWAARNWNTLHKVEFLAPRYGELPGELAPRGFDAWTHTWLWRFRDVFAVSWNLDGAKIALADIPSSAFDSPEQRARVAQLLAAYNKTLTLTPAEDRAFGEIARERTALHPLRTRVKVPLMRSLALWFAPRVELLPYTGQMFPISSEWENDREDLCVTLALVVINAAYLGLAAIGAWIGWKYSPARPAVLLLLVFIVVRTAFIAWFAETPEPRYVLECFPALIALAAIAFSRSVSSRPPARDESSAGKFVESVPSPGLPARP
ncbi:MAG: glycosyltransferase family 39 protein [Candidatus Acidiferrales bacterium]